jgi:acyl carrier protein
VKNVREKINAVLLEIQSRNRYKAVELKDEFRIVSDLGFSSLDIAELLALLEMELGVDPFAQGVSIMDVHTIGKLHEVYAVALERDAVEVA